METPCQFNKIGKYTDPPLLMARYFCNAEIRDLI